MSGSGEQEPDGLPVAWRMALRYCPHCSGTGQAIEGRDCLYCEATGDLFGVLLRAAYRMGQEDSAQLVRGLHQHTVQAVERLQVDGGDIRHLKWRLNV